MADLVNPLGDLYKSFMYILDNIVIKYTGKAEDNETTLSKMNANSYLDALNKRDTFFTYVDYTEDEMREAGITIDAIIEEGLLGNIREIPNIYRDNLLQIRRKKIISEFEETNEYYRELNGYPPLDDGDIFFLREDVANYYNIEPEVPIHRIQDHYNAINDGDGDYLIHLVEGLGFIKELQEKYPDKKYLNYIGSGRISLERLRTAKNFQILKISRPNVKNSLIDAFIDIYEQCREYFVSVVYNYQYRSFFDKYDNFIAMCITLMTVQQVVMRQLSSYINRDFFDIHAVKALYEAYNIPYDLNIDEITQNNLLRHLNLFIQNKATDKVIYDISYLLGFTNIKVYKYFISKDRKYDAYGVPIVEYTTRFNSETGEQETIPDYKKMYDVYFQKFEVKDDKFIHTFNNQNNHVAYEDVTTKDPYWIEDQNLQDRVWSTTYNFVESKYLSLGISYNITNIMFENIILMKMLMSKNEDISDVSVILPKITGSYEIPIFDVIVALICLTSYKHNLYGEIISVPTQVIHVLDYINNKEHGDLNRDTLRFNFKYLLDPTDESDKNEDMRSVTRELIDHICEEDKSGKLVDTLGFNFEYATIGNLESNGVMSSIRNILTQDDYEKFVKYIDIISQDLPSSDDKITAINEIYSNIKNLRTLLYFYLTKISNKRKDYEAIKTLYDTIFYSEEMDSIFQIKGSLTGVTRTAYTYFEFLYNRNPMLYSALFSIDMPSEYNKELEKRGLTENGYSYNDFLSDVERGEIFIDYGKISGDTKDEDTDISNKEDKAYFYINHIIGRIETIIHDIEYLYLMNDSDTPLADLLLRLVRFFKSYTVDILGLDQLIVMDMKTENCIKLFDEIHSMSKNIDAKELLRLSYSDDIHSILATMSMNDEMIHMRDQISWLSELSIDKNLKIDDKIYKILSKLELNRDKLDLYDTCLITASRQMDEKLGMRDKIHDMWFE